MTDGDFDAALADALALANGRGAARVRPAASRGPYENNGSAKGSESGTFDVCDALWGPTSGSTSASRGNAGSRSAASGSASACGSASHGPGGPRNPADAQEATHPHQAPHPGQAPHPDHSAESARPTRSTHDADPAAADRHTPAPGTTPARGAHRSEDPAAPWGAAREIAGRAAAGPPAPETSLLGEALGRTLAAPLAALTDLPSFDTSAMDGWAVSGPGPWRLDPPAGDRAEDGAKGRATSPPAQDAADVTEQAEDRPVDPGAPSPAGSHPGILAGHAPIDVLPDGHAIRIATGARVPGNATAVLRSEHCEVRGLGDGRARLFALRPPSPGQDIRPRGQECRRGDQLLPAGALVTPAVLGLAAAAGYDELTTYPRPRVEVLILGDELLQHGLPQEGRIRDALGPMLAPWLHALGAEAAPPRHLADDADSLYAAIAGSTADVIITTGGTASGPVDHVHPTLRRLGADVLVDGVEVRPGHPMLLARITPHRHLVGLPGNPLAAVSGLLTLAEPLLRTLAARRPATAYPTPLAGAVHGHPHDTRLVPVAYRDDDQHGVVAAPLHYNGPAMLRGIAAADALAVIPAGGADRGAEVELLDLPWSAGAAGGWATPDTAYGPAGASDSSAPWPPSGAHSAGSAFPAHPTGGTA
ncbi:molybdopterin-binding protein [Streptomyces sp. NPDC017993]|uniref:molybdopterin molybdotransferase MoeA n=1 Tax=Streptomyces sp. NPDC017993 TaxID=3365027 RepID=UPI0037896F37